MSQWWEKYVGIPFKAMGRDMKGVDCAGLGMLMLKREKGVVIDESPLKYTAEQMRHYKSLKEIDALLKIGLKGWQEVPEKDAKPFDLCLYKIHGIECHCGMVVDEGHILHVEERHSVHYAPIRLQGYVLSGVLRHESQM